MNATDALLELVIAARERDGEMDPRTARMIAVLERRVMMLRERARRRLRGYVCVRCERMSRRGLLCSFCAGEAPAAIRHAFPDAKGLRGMRRAAAMVRAWARGVDRVERRAA